MVYIQLHHVDGLTLSGVKQLLEAKDNFSKDLLTLTGSSGRICGVVRILARVSEFAGGSI